MKLAKRTLARKVLATPPLFVVAFYAAVFSLMALIVPVAPESFQNPIKGLLSWIFWILAVIWAFALFSVVHPALRMGRGLVAKTFFSLTLISFVVSLVVLSLFGSSRYLSDPLIFLSMFVPLLLSVISMGFAVSALQTFEGGNGWPFTYTTSNTITAILFLPVGIWFLRGRIQNLLLRTEGLTRFHTPAALARRGPL